MPKIQTYSNEISLTDNHIFITEDGTPSAVTKKSNMGIVKTYILNGLSGEIILTYTSSTAYAVGDFIVYSNCLYKCNTAYTSGDTFDSTKWDKIGGDIDFSALTDMLLAGTNFTITTDSVNETFTFSVEGHTISNYVSGEDYVVGDIVIYQSSIYQCNTAHTSTSIFDSNKWTVTGVGQAGVNAYVWFKWSSINPTQDSDISDTPNNYIGVYSGTATTAPTTYTSYTWYKYKGETGATGTAGSHIYNGIAITGTNTTPTPYLTGITYSNVDDLYISTAAGSVDNLYKCTTAGNDSTALWVYMHSIKGGGASIDDTVTSASTVWSSNKVNGELLNKANSEHTHIKSDITDYEDYTLPIASTSALGGVKVDGNSITITAEGIISSLGGGGSNELWYPTYNSSTGNISWAKSSSSTTPTSAHVLGTDGLSAYASAELGGYTDTQANFYADLAAMQGLAAGLEALL